VREKQGGKGGDTQKVQLCKVDHRDRRGPKQERYETEINLQGILGRHLNAQRGQSSAQKVTERKDNLANSSLGEGDDLG